MIFQKKTTFTSLLSQMGWYSSDPQDLKQNVTTYLSKIPRPSLSPLKALIVPHAGYTYSGEIAAHGYSHIRHHAYRRVIIIGPSHRYMLKNSGSILPVDTYKTPLGEICLDVPFIEKLLDSSFFIESTFIKYLSKFHISETHAGIGVDCSLKIDLSTFFRHKRKSTLGLSIFLK